MKNKSAFFLIVLIIIVLGATAVIWSKIKLEKLILLKNSLVEKTVGQKVLAQDIYPLFFCPCCGQPLDKKNICCPMAQERIDYIDSLTAKNLSEKEVLTAYVKKYGLNSFIDKEKQKEVQEDLAKSAPPERPIITLTSESQDLGDISQKKGMVTTFFEIKNEGKKDLIINKLDSSCGCTSASIVFRGQEGPRFAMAGHGIEGPKNWQVVIPASQTAQLKVYYDPNVHKDLRGPVIREIYIYSNDPIDFEKKIQIELNQTD